MPQHEVDVTGSDAPLETVGNKDLIASDRVAGTSVHSRNGQKIGHIRSLMIDKRSGQVAHVIISDGGFLGLGGDRYHAVRWQGLVYKPELGGYECEELATKADTEWHVSAEDADMQIW